MTDEAVVERTVNWRGLHGVHVVGAQPIDRERWLGEAPPGAECVEFWEYQDEDLGLYHLRVWWKERSAR